MVAPSGTVISWGQNVDGQFGIGSFDSDPHPIPMTVPFPDGVTVSQLSTGYFHSLALSSTSDVYAWGRGDDGEMGNGGTANVAIPTKIDFF